MSYRTYTAHMRPLPTGAEVPARDVVLVPERGSFWAFLFGPFWALWHGMWLVAGLLLLLILGLQAYPGMPHPWLLLLALGVFMGLEGFHLKRWSLSLSGYVAVGIVGGEDEDMAAERFYGLVRAGKITLPRFRSAPAAGAAGP